jgi:hypothetical protein
VNIGAISKQAQTQSAGYIDESLQTTHTELGNRFEGEEKIIYDMIRTFRKFAEQWM